MILYAIKTDNENLYMRQTRGFSLYDGRRYSLLLVSSRRYVSAFAQVVAEMKRKISAFRNMGRA